MRTIDSLHRMSVDVNEFQRSAASCPASKMGCARLRNLFAEADTLMSAAPDTMAAGAMNPVMALPTTKKKHTTMRHAKHRMRKRMTRGPMLRIWKRRVNTDALRRIFHFYGSRHGLPTGRFTIRRRREDRRGTAPHTRG